MVEKKRHGCLAAYLIFMMMVGVLGAAIYFFAGNIVAQGNPEIPSGLRPVFGIFNLLMAGCALAIWKWKKWGFWGFVAIGVLGGGMNIYLSDSLIPIIFVAAGILVMYGILRIGNTNQGWKQLE